MNILQLIPKLNVGGVEKGTVEVARYLTLNGNKAVVVSGGGRLEKQLAAVGARHYTLPVGRKNPAIMVYCYFKLKQIIRKENIDIIHARSRIPAIAGYFAARSLNRTFITTAHGQYKKHLISRVMGWGKVVIAANDTMARHMKDNFDVPLRKIKIVPRGVDLKKFSFAPPEYAPSKKFRVGMISRFTPLKGHLDFLKAVSYVSRRVPNIEVVIMGDRALGKEDYVKKIDLTIKRLMVENIVKFKGSDEDVASVLHELDVFVSANREQEAFGRSIIEAQSCGVPIVATSVGGVVENIINEETGLLCEPMNPSDIADKIMRYVEDRELSKKVALNGRKHVEENYSLDKMMARTMEVYSDVLFRKNILIFKISSLGDIILSIPSLRAIRDRFPKASIKLLVDVRFREVVDNCPYIDEVITCDLKGRDKGAGFFRLAGRLRSEDFDISIDLQNSRKSHLLAYLSVIAERYGYDNGKYSRLLNRKISLPKKNIKPVDHQGYVLGLLGITSFDKHLELWPSGDNKEWADKFIEESWLKKDQKVVVFCISASKRWQSKNWGIGPMAELADMLAREKCARVVLVGTEEDIPAASEFLKRTNAKPIDAVGKTTVPQLIGLISRCDALVTGDSAPMHIAAATGTPFVAIFGPTDPGRHLPPSDKCKVFFRENIRCTPCYSPSCSRKMRCMKDIKTEEVFGAVSELLECAHSA